MPKSAGESSSRTIRIVDVAKEAQVSTATVSRTLNDSARVDPELAERVRAAAAKLGYRPNAIARNLRRRGTTVLGLIIPNINNPFYTVLARGVEDAAAAAGFSVILCNTDEDRVKQDRYLEVAAQERVAGVILAPRSEDSDVSSLQSSRIPLVVVDRQLRQPADFVTAASFEGAVMATEHLLRQGWRRPACITRPADTATAEQRRLGYEDVMRRHQVPVRVVHVPFHGRSEAGVLNGLAAADDAPDSLLTIDSMLALEVMAELKKQHRRIGRDAGLISFDDPPWAMVVDPPLSVVAQPAYEIGTEATRLLVERITGRSDDPQRLVMSTTLIVRGSCRRHEGPV